MVLEILYPKPGVAPPDPFIVDIVAVHGLNGDPTNTWKHSANNHFWLQDSLPLDVKGARVMTYGYNADVAFGNTTADVWDHAKSLLGSLIDERETDDESKRPIIFIAHSLGGIIVKQALVWAHREPQYQTIRDHTLGIVFFGTPHRGSDKANYGKILANVATGVMHKSKSKLISALQSNSETLMRLTSEFKFEAPNMEIMTFYETKPMGIFSGLIVEKQSALLELSHEDSQPVDANHSDMCKVYTRNDDTYNKLVKRVNRMLKGKDKLLPAPGYSHLKLRNMHFELPFDVSPYFTGGDDVSNELRENCLPLDDPGARIPQKRFILHGLGGSGKTQMALKFASDHRERFWGVFFIDTSSADIAEQAFSKMARICKVGEKMEDFKRFLANSLEPWLLILDNADDPSLSISQFFPVGNRGTIIITSRNPDCRSHATVGSRELREMKGDEAINLLLKSGDLPSEGEDLRVLAQPIVQTLGYLALAVNHAGASIRQKTCSLEDYLVHYTRHRKKLLSSRPVQASSDYKYTVYTTWEISVESIKELARNATDSAAANALDFLTLFGFCHFDNITEGIFRSAWDQFFRAEGFLWWESNLLGMIRDRRLMSWDSYAYKEAIQLLASYSLIHISGPDNRVSLHPLVHSWIRDSLNEEEHSRWWNITVSTLALASDKGSYYLQKQLKVHLRHCIGTGQIDDLFLEDDVPLDRLEISSYIIFVYFDHPWNDALNFAKRALGFSKKFLGDECHSTCMVSYLLAQIFNSMSEYQKTSDLLQDKIDVCIRVLGQAHPVTSCTMSVLSRAYRNLGREQRALELAQRNLAICEKLLGDRDDTYIDALYDVGMLYLDLGRNEKAVDLFEKALAKAKENWNEENVDVLYSEYHLARAYSASGQHQAALEMFQRSLEKDTKVLGEDHPNTLNTMVRVAVEHGGVGRPEEGIPLAIKALEISSEIGREDLLEGWKEDLKWLESESAKTSTTMVERPVERQILPHSEGEGMSSRKRWRLWSRRRH
ncbi:MAG: hypothetical protein ASARMPRED_006495 [Alectoria sarmentosa]|nr:MAG: hypothetical protein ASARMPRED_006495 [Alectoria sarmentosa]